VGVVAWFELGFEFVFDWTIQLSFGLLVVVWVSPGLILDDLGLVLDDLGLVLVLPWGIPRLV
jgi:hypothetical protein